MRIIARLPYNRIDHTSLHLFLSPKFFLSSRCVHDFLDQGLGSFCFWLTTDFYVQLFCGI